ncbi:MAG: sortase [bacterium]|nr:sortase [bacterium]
MALYYYLKSEVKPIGRQSGQILRLPFISRRALRLTSLFFFSFGIGLLSWLVWPFLEWRLIYAPRFTDVEIMRPLPSRTERGAVAGVATEDLAYARNWFPQASPQTVPPDSIKNYTLSIPKLKIEDAVALVGGEDLSKSLIHYGGTALPGRNGTAVIFGHSVLPQFFNPKSYMTIFSTIHTLKKGDRIVVKVDDVEYKYKIFGFEIVDPSNTSFLQQKYDNAYLYLITCTPPGTYLKRLVVKAKLESL